MVFDIAIVWTSLPRLVMASGATLGIAVGAMAAGLAGGAALTLARSAKWRPLSLVIAVLRSLVFGTPLLVTVLIAFYVLPAAGIDLNPAAAGILAIGTTSAFFQSEMIRGCLATLPGGQIEAATALGVRAPVIWGKIVIPQVARAMAPLLVGEFTLVVKATALLSAITVTDLLRTAQQIYAVNYRPLETLSAAALVYLAITLPAGRLGERLGRRPGAGRSQR